MISPRSRTTAWIDQIRETSPKTDPILIEKMIMALVLIEHLQMSGLDFILKGGTSLAVILGKLQRFSIDIDILIADTQNLHVFLDAVINHGAFLRYEEDKRGGKIPKTHFHFYYASEHQRKEDSILLDILIEENLYPCIQEVEIKSPFLCLEGENTRITCPTIECLLGDKLTAFCPHTTGIHYRNDKDLEIAKQLFDLGILFDAAEDVALIGSAHEIIASRELAYRGLEDLAPRDVLLDTFGTACQLGMQGGVGDPDEYKELVEGISKLRGYVFGGTFSLDTAIRCAAKIAYLSALILGHDQSIAQFKEGMDLSTWNISDPKYNKLNKLKKINPMAFYYFYLAQELTHGDVQTA